MGMVDVRESIYTRFPGLTFARVLYYTLAHAMLAQLNGIQNLFRNRNTMQA